jgi:hypothetical protein
VDDAGWKARRNVDEIARLGKDGKTAEARKMATDTMAILGIKL